jgi:predicted DNA-binding transcriptional regulator AlpA
VSSITRSLGEALIGPPQLSERWAISIKSLYHRVERGQVPPPIRIGSLLRWRPEDIRRWEEEQQQSEAEYQRTRP